MGRQNWKKNILKNLKLDWDSSPVLLIGGQVYASMPPFTHFIRLSLLAGTAALWIACWTSNLRDLQYWVEIKLSEDRITNRNGHDLLLFCKTFSFVAFEMQDTAQVI